jgi:hypothetical protein
MLGGDTNTSRAARKTATDGKKARSSPLQHSASAQPEETFAQGILLRELAPVPAASSGNGAGTGFVLIK